METQKNVDSWSSLHTLLDIDVGTEEQPVTEPAEKPVVAVLETATVETSTFFVDPPPSPIEDSKKNEDGKRPRLDRFPKINLWETPQGDPLEAALGGTKPTVKSGEAFTSKKWEKVESASSHTTRRKEDTILPPTSASVEKPVSKGRDPWSMIASQVGCIASSEAFAEEVVEHAVENIVENAIPSVAGPELPEHRKTEDAALGHGRRPLPSMFDDDPIRESAESTAVRNIFNAVEPKPLADAEKRLSSILDDNPPQNNREPERREQRQHVRGQRNDEFQRTPPREKGDRHELETDVDDLHTEERTFDDRKRQERSFRDRNALERGKRGSRYVKTERFGTEQHDQDSRWDVPDRSVRTDAGDHELNTWDADEESKPVERSGRQRPRRFEERVERSPSRRFREERHESAIRDNREESAFAAPDDFEQTHRSIPSWDEAISAIIEANVARHVKHGPDQRRGRGVRS